MLKTGVGRKTGVDIVGERVRRGLCDWTNDNKLKRFVQD